MGLFSRESICATSSPTSRTRRSAARASASDTCLTIVRLVFVHKEGRRTRAWIRPARVRRLFVCVGGVILPPWAASRGTVRWAGVRAG